MEYIQEIARQAAEYAKAGGIELTLTLNPYAEHESETFGYQPTMSLQITPWVVAVGTVSPDGEINFNTVGES